MDNIKSVPNQKIVNVNKEPCDKKNLYSRNNLKALDTAAKTLQSKGGFKLWTYIAKNADKYTFALSNKDFKEWSGLARTAYDTAVQELITEKYLVEKEPGSNIYIFHELPKEEPEEQIIKIEYERTDRTPAAAAMQALGF